MIWFADPLHRLPKTWRFGVYAWLGVFFARLAIWYGIEVKWGRP